MERLVPQSTAVVVVDIQERLAPAMPEERLRQVVRATTILVESARLLGAHVLATEQYTKGLGRTIEAVGTVLDAARAPRFEKVHFSAAEAPGFRDALRATAATDVVVVGMEAHVCVFQTVRDLAAAGLRVYLPVDGTCSRRDDHREAGHGLAERAGAVLTTAESVVFDWMRLAGTDEFRAASKLVR